MLYELCTLKHPFTGANQAGLILRIVRGKYEPIPSFYSKDLAEIVAKCLTRDTRKRPSIHDLLELDSVQKKARTLNIKIPKKDEVIASIENQKNEMITTFQRKKTDIEPKSKSPKESKFSSKGRGDRSTKDKGLVNKSKESNLQSYKNDIPGKGKNTATKQDNKTEHQIKIEQLESELQEKKKKHEDYLKKRDSTKISNNDHLPPSYLKEPEIVKNFSEGDKKNKGRKELSGNLNNGKYANNKTALACDLPKTTNGQKVIKPGMKHAESEIVIQKPKKVPNTSQENRNKTTNDVAKNLRTRGTQQTGLSRQAINASRKGSDIQKKKVAKEKKEKAKKKDIDEVFNLPDYPKQDSSSSEEEKYNTMNKPAMQLVAELRAKQNSKIKKHYSAMPSKNNDSTDLNNQKMLIPKESECSS